MLEVNWDVEPCILEVIQAYTVMLDFEVIPLALEDLGVDRVVYLRDCVERLRGNNLIPSNVE